VDLEARELLSGFFLPQLSQSELGILKPLLVEHPGKVTAHIEKTTTITSVVRQTLFRMAMRPFNRHTKESTAPGDSSVPVPPAPNQKTTVYSPKEKAVRRKPAGWDRTTVPSTNPSAWKPPLNQEKSGNLPQSLYPIRPHPFSTDLGEG